MKVLALTRYARSGASSRLRFLQYVPYLKQQGWSVSHRPLLDDRYLTRHYTGRRPRISSLVAHYAERLRILLKSRMHDVVWIEGELFPFLPALAERWLSRRGIPFVVDFDDALFHRYDLNKNPFIRVSLGKKIDTVMRCATAVVAGNEYIAARAREAGASEVNILPTVVDLSRYPSSTNFSGDTATVGWIGTPITARHLVRILPVLGDLSDVRLVAVGLSSLQTADQYTNIELKPWNEETEVTDIAGFDIGIMPLPDTPWERGKCAYKLIQYMACGLPVIASPVGLNQEVVRVGQNGFLATSDVEWRNALTTLAEDVVLRGRMGTAGRRLVEEEFCLSVTAPKLIKILGSAASS